MKKTTVIALLVCLAAIAPAADDAEKVLHVYTWEEYFEPGAVKLFEEKHGCRVEFAYYDSNPIMHQTMMEGGGYDIITPIGNAAANLHRKGVLLELDHSLLPNIRHLNRADVERSEDPGMVYSVPYVMEVTGIAYNKTMVPADLVGSWRMLGDARLAKRTTLLHDMREVMGAALKCLGRSLNSVDAAVIGEAAEIAMQWKANLGRFDLDDATDGLVQGVYAAVQTYNGDAAMAISQNPDIGFFVPDEGAALTFDLLVVGADTAQPELAHAFINHFLDLEMARRNMEWTKYYMPNVEGYARVSRELLENPAFVITGEVMARCELIRYLGETRALYDDAWEKILFNKK